MIKKIILLLILSVNFLYKKSNGSPVKLVVMQKNNRKVWLFADIHQLESPQKSLQTFKALKKRLKLISKNNKKYKILVEGPKYKGPSNDADFLDLFSFIKKTENIKIKKIEAKSRIAWAKIHMTLINLQSDTNDLANYLMMEKLGIKSKKPKSLSLKKILRGKINLTFNDLKKIINKELKQFENLPKKLKKQIKEYLITCFNQLIEAGFTKEEIETKSFAQLFLDSFTFKKRCLKETESRTKALFHMFSDTNNPLDNLIEVKMLGEIFSEETDPNILLFAGAYHTEKLEELLSEYGFKTKQCFGKPTLLPEDLSYIA